MFRFIYVSFFRRDAEQRQWEKVENRREDVETIVTKVTIHKPWMTRDNEIHHPRNDDESGGPTTPPIMAVEEITNSEMEVGPDVDDVHEGGEEENRVKE